MCSLAQSGHGRGVRMSAVEQGGLGSDTSERTAPLQTPSNLSSNSVELISAALTEMLADMFALYLKTKNFHWHVSGPHFRDDHRMLDEQGAQILTTTDAMAERVRKVGGTTI